MSRIDRDADGNDHMNIGGLNECIPEGAVGVEEGETTNVKKRRQVIKILALAARDHSPFSRYWTDGVGVQCVLFFYTYKCVLCRMRLNFVPTTFGYKVRGRNYCRRK